MMPNFPRCFLGANSAMYAVAIAESAPIATPINVLANINIKTFIVNADKSAPIIYIIISAINRNFLPSLSVINEAHDYLYELASDKHVESKGVKRAFFVSSLMGLFIIANGVNIPLIYGPFIISGLHIFPAVSNKAIANSYAIGATAILGAVLVASTYIGFKFIDIAGRRFLALLGFAGMAISDITGGILYLYGINIGLLLGLAFYLVFFGIGGGGIAFLIQGEYFPTHKRVKFAALAVVIEWMTSFTVDEIFPYMDSVLHLGYSVIVFGIVSVIAYIVFYFTMPETKNVTVEQIVELFEENSLFDLGKINSRNLGEISSVEFDIKNRIK